MAWADGGVHACFGGSFWPCRRTLGLAVPWAGTPAGAGTGQFPGVRPHGRGHGGLLNSCQPLFSPAHCSP